MKTKITFFILPKRFLQLGFNLFIILQFIKTRFNFTRLNLICCQFFLIICHSLPNQFIVSIQFKKECSFLIELNLSKKSR